MTDTLQNDCLSVRISSKGAELQSVFSHTFGREYLWQAAPEAWNAHSLLLFPAAGRIDRSRILAGGQEYPLPMHGFAKDMEFTRRERTERFLALELTDTEETRRMFPYPFRLRVEFSLEGDTLTEHFQVFNTGGEEMSFGFGAHPGFFCPIVLGESADDYVLEFDRPQSIHKIVLEPYTRLCTSGREPFLKDASLLPLSEHFFDGGPVLAEGCNASWIQLRSLRSGNRIRMGMEGFPYLTLWGVPHKMSLICIEPWCGLSDFSGTDHIWESKPANQHLAPGEVFSRKLWFQPGQCPVPGR